MKAKYIGGLIYRLFFSKVKLYSVYPETERMYKEGAKNDAK